MPNQLTALLAYAGFNQETRRYDEAESFYKRAIALATATEQNRERAIAFTALGETYHSQKMLKEAQQALQEALNIERTLAAARPNIEQKADLATTLNDLGIVIMESCQSSKDVRPEDAEKALTESIQIRRVLADSNQDFKPYLGKSINNLALLYVDMNRLDESRLRFEEAISCFKELTDQDRLTYGDYFATLLSNYGNILMRIARKPGTDANMQASLTEKADSVYREAISIFRELCRADFVSFGPELADALVNQALSMSDHEKAIQSIGEAVELLGTAYARDSQTYQQAFALALHDRASLKWTTYGDSSGLKTELRDSARQDVETAIEIRRRLKIPRDMAASLSLLAVICVDMKDYQCARQAAEDALDWNEKSPQQRKDIQDDMNALLKIIEM